MKRVTAAIILVSGGLYALFGIPAYLHRAPEWYFQLPNVLPPQMWEPFAKTVGSILIAVAILLVLPWKRIGQSLSNFNEAMSASMNDNRWLIGRNVRNDKAEGIPYQHADFPSGTVVFVSTRIREIHPKSEIGGRVLLTTSGVRYPILEEIEGDQSKLVPVLLAAGSIVYAEPQYVSRYLDNGEMNGTLPGGKHGYGCRCFSCVSQLDR